MTAHVTNCGRLPTDPTTKMPELGTVDRVRETCARFFALTHDVEQYVVSRKYSRGEMTEGTCKRVPGLTSQE